MRATMAILLLLLLAACGNGSKNNNKKADDNLDFTTKPREDQPDNRGKSGPGNNSGNANNAGNAAKEPEPQPQPEPEVPQSVARTNIEGKITEFKHVIALWDEVNHSVRFVACTQEIPAGQIARLRNGEPIEGGEIPHIIFSFVLEEGTTSMTKGKVENWFYDFHWLTSLSPASLRNIGKETISRMDGDAKLGQMLKLVIKFESAKVKDAPAEQFDFEVNFDVKLE